MRNHRSKREEAEHKARMLFLKGERAKAGARRVEDEARRHEQMVAKTKRLRELRLAKEAAECDTAVRGDLRRS